MFGDVRRETERIPRELLDKPYNERTPIEKEQAEKYMSEIFQTEKEVDFSEGKEKLFEKRITMICDNPKVEEKRWEERQK